MEHPTDLYCQLLDSPAMTYEAKRQLMNAYHLLEDGEYSFHIGEQKFTVGQIPAGEFKNKWVWSTDTSESLPFASPLEAEKDAARYVAQQAQDERDQAEEADQTRLYGSDREQVNREYYATR